MFSACAGVTQLQEIHPTWVFKGGMFTSFFMEFILAICGEKILEEPDLKHLKSNGPYGW